MSTLYWAFEYGKVLWGYLFLMLLWPSVVFGRYLKKKTIIYRFGFCVTVPVVIINTVVLMFGVFHILNKMMIILVFFGTFIAAVIKNIMIYIVLEYRRAGGVETPDVHSLYGKYNRVVIVGAFCILYLSYIREAVGFLISEYRSVVKKCNPKNVFLGILKKLRDGILVILEKHSFLIVIFVYGVGYFSYGAFQVHSYGYRELYVHHEWVCGLMEGKIFTEGVYPQAMHSFIYCINALWDIRVYSIILFLQGIHTTVFFISVYLLLRQVFRCRYTPMLVLMLFLTLDLSNADLIYSMFRFQYTMPMEFGLYTICLSALYLKKYLNDDFESIGRKRASKYYWSGNLLLFMTALAAAATIHFHVLLMALSICAVFAVCTWKRVFYRKYVIPLAISGLCACLIAIIPMAGAMMQGTMFHDSVDWAINSMDGRDSIKQRQQREKIAAGEKIDEEIQMEEKAEGGGIEYAISILPGIYEEGYVALYGEERGRLYFLMTIVIVGVCLLISQRFCFQNMRECYSGYLSVALGSVLYIVTYAAPMIGLPDILPEGRFCVIGHMMLLAVMVVPVDILFSSLKIFCNEIVLWLASLASIVGIYGGAIIFDSFRGGLFYELLRYDSAAMVTNSIIDMYSQYNYTVVSPADELYQMEHYGRHEDLVSFVKQCNNKEYSIPSEYVFIYVEKKPILYAQPCFYKGLSWLGDEKYSTFCWETYFLRYPDNICQDMGTKVSQISEGAAQQEIPEGDNSWIICSNLDNRIILESKTYEWCKRFAERYPSALNTYYEDENFVCYYFRQNKAEELYNLGIG